MKMVVDAFQSDIDGGISTLILTGGGTKRWFLADHDGCHWHGDRSY